MFESIKREEMITSQDLKKVNHDFLFNEALPDINRLGIIHHNVLRAVIIDIRTFRRLMLKMIELDNLNESQVLAKKLRDRLQSKEWVEKPADSSRVPFLKEFSKGTQLEK